MIRIEGLNVSLPNFRLQEIDLTVAENEFFALMGPTGAGKTVLLEAIVGLVPIQRGRIFIGQRDVTGLPPEKRKIGLVYQDHALFPHQTVLQNITYGLHFRRLQQADADKRREHLVDVLRLSPILNRFPAHLSGGEKQRAALARALMAAPEVLLLDEPLSALDPNFKEEVRDLLKELHKSSNTTFLMVTHDFSDALFLAGQAAVINQGRIEQSGAVMDLFRRPNSLFTAEFVGMKNVFQARFEGAAARVGDLCIKLARQVDSGRQYLSVRPEDVIISRERLPINGSAPFKCEVRRVVDHGFYFTISVKAGGAVFRSLMPKSMLQGNDPQDWQEAYVHLRPGSLHAF